MKSPFSEFLRNLEDFRRFILSFLLVSLVFSIIAYAYFPEILKYISKPAGKLYFFSLYEAFFSKLMFSFFSGIFLAIPIGILLLWNFIKNALYSKEKKEISLLLAFTAILFYAGFAIAFFIIFPFAVKFFLSFGNNIILPVLSVKNYIIFFLSLCFTFGIIFQLPIIFIYLSYKGLITTSLLESKRKEFIVIVFILAAIITPPDIFTQLFVALPFIITFEISLVIAKILHRKNFRP